MGNVSRALGYLASIAAFCLAIAFFFTSDRSNRSLLSEVKNNLNDNNVMYEQMQDIDEQTVRVVEYRDVISMLMKDIGTDIEINGTILDADTYDYMQFDFSSIPKADYLEAYERNAAGKITKIILTIT